MNYIIEGNIDFYSELYKNDECNEQHTNIDNICMLTHLPLIENYITLPCKHTFNYLPLYNEVSTKLTINNYDSDKLHNNQIKCPYCRAKFEQLLPYIPIYDGVEKKNGVNWPEKDCMQHMNCGWVYKSGKNKGQKCEKNAYQCGLEVYCYIHWNIVNKNKAHEVVNSLSTWTNEMETLFRSKHIVDLKKILEIYHLPVSGTKKILVKRIINAKISY